MMMPQPDYIACCCRARAQKSAHLMLLGALCVCALFQRSHQRSGACKKTALKSSLMMIVFGMGGDG